MLEPGTKTLGPALGKLERSVRIYPALRIGFDKLYSFTNDESGIRHALLWTNRWRRSMRPMPSICSVPVRRLCRLD